MLVFSLSYCYTCSMICYWHHHVRPSVCLSVTLCIVALRVGVQDKKLHQRVPSGQVPICPFRHFCYFATKRAEKNESKKTRTWVFL